MSSKTTDEQNILELVRGAGANGHTCDEVEVKLDLTHQTASARVHDLMRAGEIVLAGFKRPTRSGRNATVWVAA